MIIHNANVGRQFNLGKFSIAVYMNMNRLMFIQIEKES